MNNNVQRVINAVKHSRYNHEEAKWMDKSANKKNEDKRNKKLKKIKDKEN